MCPLTPRPTARALFRTFVAASKALLHGTLAPEKFCALVEGGARGLAYRHFAVACALSTLGWCIHRSAETQREVYMRLLRLRGLSQHQGKALLEGGDVRAPVRPFGFEAPLLGRTERAAAETWRPGRRLQLHRARAA